MATGTNKGGYDYDFVTPPPKSVECSVCLLTLCDPHVLSCCGYEFCQACIERVQKDGKPCPVCNEPRFTTFLHKKLVREVNALVVRCPQKELGCDWEGELGQVKKHLEAGESMIEGCGYVLVTCSYGCGIELPRHQLANHEMEVCPKRPIERQMASLMQKFEAVVTDNNLLRQELQEVHGEVKEMEETILELKKQNKQLVQKDKELKNDVDKQITTIKQTCGSLKVNTLHLATPPFYFAIDNIKHLISTDQVWSSNPFYSHPGGYKMMIRVYPNGFGNRKGTYLSMFACLQRGEFDDQLQWPFNGEVTVEAYNRSHSRWSKQVVIGLNNDCGEEVACRPKKVRGVEYGYSQYISHEELKQHYLTGGGDTVSIRVTAVKLA